MILVTGAAGKTGQAVIRALVRRGAAVRAFVYRPEQTETVEKLGVLETMVGDMEDAAAYWRAVSGVRAVYHVCSNMNSNEVAIGRIAIAAAQAAGIEHFVYHSVLHPQTEAMPHHWHKLRVEELLFESGLEVTIVQPAAYMQNILAGWQTVVEQGLYRVPYPVETRLSLVDLEDVAAAVATVLAEPGHAGATYELAGPEALTQTDLAAILGRTLGRSVRAEQIPISDWAEGARATGLGRYQIDTLIKMFRYYERNGFIGNPRVLGWLLGRPPSSFEQFAARVVESRSS